MVIQRLEIFIQVLKFAIQFIIVFVDAFGTVIYQTTNILNRTVPSVVYIGVLPWFLVPFLHQESFYLFIYFSLNFFELKFGYYECKPAADLLYHQTFLRFNFYVLLTFSLNIHMSYDISVRDSQLYLLTWS